MKEKMIQAGVFLKKGWFCGVLWLTPWLGANDDHVFYRETFDASSAGKPFLTKTGVWQSGKTVGGGEEVVFVEERNHHAWKISGKNFFVIASPHGLTGDVEIEFEFKTVLEENFSFYFFRGTKKTVVIRFDKYETVSVSEGEGSGFRKVGEYHTGTWQKMKLVFSLNNSQPEYALILEGVDLYRHALSDVSGNSKIQFEFYSHGQTDASAVLIDNILVTEPNSSKSSSVK